MAASTMASSVVGTAIQGTPRMKVAARNPAASVTAPPPTATTRERRVQPARRSRAAARSSTARVLPRSPSGRITSVATVASLRRRATARRATEWPPAKPRDHKDGGGGAPLSRALG